MERFPIRINGASILLGLFIGIGLFVLFRTVLAWTNPTQAPPGGSGTGIVPAGSVMYFDLSSCPAGWTEVTNARGRYLVALPSGGTLGGTAGTALSNLENRSVGQHNHSIADPGHTHGFEANVLTTRTNPEVFYAHGGGGVDDITQTQSAQTGISINDAGTTAGTNAPYIQYLLCKKS